MELGMSGPIPVLFKIELLGIVVGPMYGGGRP
jgi:hypothetical protein